VTTTAEPIRAVLFDFAGTLFARADAERDVAFAARSLGVSLSAGECKRLAAQFLAAGIPGGPYPKSVPADAAVLYAERDLAPERHRAAYLALLATVPAPAGLAAAVYERVLTAEGWVAYSDSYATVRTLIARGIAVALVSNTGFDLRPILREHGMDELAAHASLSFELGVAKPAPAIFEHALADVDAAPDEALMVGDHPAADGGATAIGMRTLILPMSPAGAEQGLARVLDLVISGQA
jgi:HAD superfamily hydrolase (TIGR01493 family)